MEHKRCEMWVNDRTGEINVLMTEPLFGAIEGKLVPVWDDIEQRLTLNNGAVRVEVVVYNKALGIELIKETVRKALEGKVNKW